MQWLTLETAMANGVLGGFSTRRYMNDNCVQNRRIFFYQNLKSVSENDNFYSINKTFPRRTRLKCIHFQIKLLNKYT